MKNWERLGRTNERTSQLGTKVQDVPPHSKFDSESTIRGVEEGGLK